MHNRWRQTKRRGSCLVDTGLFLAHVPETDVNLTHMFESRSQISSCRPIMAANIVGQFGDHLMVFTTSWVDVKLNTGVKWSCFHSWIWSEEQLRNTSELNGDHSMWFTGHWERAGCDMWWIYCNNELFNAIFKTFYYSHETVVSHKEMFVLGCCNGVVLTFTKCAFTHFHQIKCFIHKNLQGLFGKFPGHSDCWRGSTCGWGPPMCLPDRYRNPAG